MSTRLKRVLTIFASLIMLFGVITPAASAEDYTWPHNGCTKALDRPGGFDFTDACNRHDGCYAEHWSDRKTCDVWFKNDMLKVCRRAHWRVITNCVIYAHTYYGFVRWQGQPYYDSNGKMVRIETPVG